jgi:putative NADH-flavin reductase
MVKNLELIKNKDNNYAIKNEDFELELKDLKIDSKDLYDNIYGKSTVDEHEFIVKCITSLTEKEDKRILDQINALFSKINEAIKNQFNNPENEL